MVGFMTEKLKSILDEYSDVITKLLGDNLIGIYLTGSIALGGYHENKSDIDFTTLMKKPLDDNQISELNVIHKNILKKHPKNIFEGHYITLTELGNDPNEIEPIVSYYEGKIGKSYHGINIVTWFTLKKYGATVFGTPARELPFSASENELAAYVINNVNSYWKKWLSDSIKFLSVKGLYSLTSAAIEWVVLGISRMHYTLSTSDIASKDGIISHVLKHTPKKYHRIIREADYIRTNNGKKQYISIFKRRNDMIAYLEYMVDECNVLAKNL